MLLISDDRLEELQGKAQEHGVRLFALVLGEKRQVGFAREQRDFVEEGDFVVLRQVHKALLRQDVPEIRFDGVTVIHTIHPAFLRKAL
jgi:hypothetical protein